MPLGGCNRETNKLADGKNRLKKKNQRLRASEWLIWDCTGRHTGWDFEYRRLNLQITFGLLTHRGKYQAKIFKRWYYLGLTCFSSGLESSDRTSWFTWAADPSYAQQLTK